MQQEDVPHMSAVCKGQLKDWVSPLTIFKGNVIVVSDLSHQSYADVFLSFSF